MNIYLIDDYIMDFKSIWNWLNGKKTYLAMALLFLYGGLAALGYDLVWLKDTALFLGGVGLAHGVYKLTK